ncbi:MAG: GNAT family N-acetyltransferase [Paracoccaceae bacterium]
MGRAVESHAKDGGLVRKARPDDLGVIQSILNAPDNLDKLAACTDETLCAAMRSKDQSLKVLEVPPQGVAAFLWMTGLRSDPAGAKIEEFGAVEPGAGHGSTLFSAVLADFARTYPGRALWLAVAADNIGAIRFYERWGFRRKETRPAVWHRRAGPVADALIMQLAPQGLPKLTPNETEVLDVIRSANGPLTAYQILGRMQRSRGAVAPPTVYRALRGLEEAGRVCRIETLRAWAPFSGEASGVVAICDDCGSVRTVETPELFQSLSQSLAAQGFAEARPTIEVHGRCGDCAGGKA